MKNQISVLAYAFTTALLSICLLNNSTLLAQSTQDRIKQVESGLSTATKIKGAPSWTIQERMKHYGVPGLSLAIIHDHQVVAAKAYGFKDREAKEPVDTETLFQCASISKPVSAAAALRLVEEGKFKLDTDINDYLIQWKLPDNEFTTKTKVTLRHLTSHTGGLTVHGFPGYRLGQPVPSLIELLNGSGAANTGPIRVDKTPGGSFRYSGGGYCIMQQMMIEATGKSFPEIMDETVLKRIGMERSTFAHPLPKELTANAAAGYAPDGIRVSGDRHTYPEMAPAGLYSTATELAQFWIEISKAYQGESDRILSQEMAREMLTVESGSFGLGIGIRNNGGEVYLGHGGWNEGFSSEAGIHRDKGYGLVVLTNGNHPELIDEITASVARVYGWEKHSMPEYSPLEITDDVIAKVSGRYNHSGSLLIIEGDQDKLYLAANGSERIELYRVGDDQFAYATGDTLICFSDSESSGTRLSFRKPWDTKAEPGDIARRLADDERLAIEWLTMGDYDKALAGFIAQKKMNPDQDATSEDRLNQLGYQFMSNNQLDQAIDLFRINIALYPESFNTYDSLGEAYLKKGMKKLGILNYKKSLELNPQNDNATSVLKGLEK